MITIEELRERIAVARQAKEWSHVGELEHVLTQRDMQGRMTVKGFFDRYGENGIANLFYLNTEPVLQIQQHSRGLTVVDSNTSLRELNYRDDSNEDVYGIVRDWLDCVK